MTTALAKQAVESVESRAGVVRIDKFENVHDQPPCEESLRSTRRGVVGRRPLMGATVTFKGLGLLPFEHGTLRSKVSASPEVLRAPSAVSLLTSAAHEPNDGERDVAGGEGADDDQEREDERVGLSVGVHDRCTTTNCIVVQGQL